MSKPTQHAEYTKADFGRNPLMFYYEVTQACDLVCKHCRASAQENAHPEELTTEQSKALIDQIATFARKPMLVLTGGDPLKRADLFSLIRHAKASGLHVALTPSATPLATYEAFAKAQEAGVQALGISLDGADAAVHDAFRGWEGSFDRTLEMLAAARALHMPVQVNTSITRRNFHQIDQIAEVLSSQGIAMWSVFFLVPVLRVVALAIVSVLLLSCIGNPTARIGLLSILGIPPVRYPGRPSHGHLSDWRLERAVRQEAS